MREYRVKRTVRVRFHYYVYLFIDRLIFGKDYCSLFVGSLKSDISSTFGVTFIKVKVSYLLLHKHDNLVTCVFLKIRSALLTHLQLLSFCRSVMPTIPEENINSAIIEHNQELIAVFIFMKRLKPPYMGNFPLFPRGRIWIRVITYNSATVAQPRIKHENLSIATAHNHFQLRPVLLQLFNLRVNFGVRLWRLWLDKVFG